MSVINTQPEMRERRLAIVLLDLIGSTAFVQRAGPLKAAQWLQYHDRLTRSLMYRFKGREIDRSDGFLLSFERTIDAVNFGLHYQATIPPKTRLNTRIGVHVGVVAEVIQHELDTLVGAKPIELEGIAKNIAARTMSLSGPGQVLLTQEAMIEIKGRTDAHTPKGTRYALAGLYRFKGVKKPVTIYTVGISTASLQPPQGSEKVKRLGGPKRIKSHLRHMRAREILTWIIHRLAILSALYLAGLIILWLSREDARKFFDIDHPPWSWFGYLRPFIELAQELIKEI